ncbi:bifunctional 23S rRNA (guanine(2069)-N(7))-methyltransferase RlmK/23S rRNA (guanine(2445)-N(2))-methyltransferase RlmL [Ectothiorhodospiraceae bacterium WFHF3C12]|nr:bifunctional 23S rRNA (guanine(2069)-N(7))-methyltransferase RlmK/23S rRNA (guanine(2445)-N(2))-methyltransferase RlmL [Ectothiorhodospiraceae bacterium WFHF3C12]
MSTGNLTLFLTAAGGLEPLLAAEATALGLAGVTEARGGVHARATLDQAYRACLWSRFASRVLLVLDRAPVDTQDELYAWLRGLPWEDHFGAGATLAVDCNGSGAGIDNTQYGARRVKDAVVDRFRERFGTRPSVSTQRPDVRLNCHLTGLGAEIRLDLSGEPLHRRGYRRRQGGAPLKETLAAAMLARAGWPEAFEGPGALVDPMCGSGTLLVEAGWMAGDHAPGLLRDYFGFLGWRGHDAAIWDGLRAEAAERRAAGAKRLSKLVGFDQDGDAVAAAQANVEAAGLSGAVHIERRPLSRAEPPASATGGLVATNPPYGERLGDSGQLRILYGQLGHRLRRHFPGWRAVVLAGSDDQLGEIGLRADRRYTLYNGALRCRLGLFSINPDADRAPLPARDLTNRLGKNLKHLRRWARREDVCCFRVYDADLPEYALAIDLYEGEEETGLHVQEYEAPRSVDAGKAARRLHDALLVIPDALGVAPEAMRLKTRHRQTGGRQYQRQGETGRAFIVREGDARLWVNLDDYLDTGLFLDHRPIRRWLHDNADGMSVLNLFGYTGAATVQAALGGARSTLTVDLSKRYLDWAERNLRLNRIPLQQHRLERADCLKWLAEQSRGRPANRFDLIFLDPPTFSTSKGMTGTLDTQRDHPTLIRQAMALLAPGGTLIFSTNARRFRLDEAISDAFRVEDVTAWSIPEDFRRNQRIHRCFMVTHPGA